MYIPLTTNNLQPTTNNAQQGALFGLDARIAMAVFGVLTLIAGATIINNMDSSRAKSLASELSEMGKAVEAIHTDLKTDLFDALENPSEKNAFAALFDNLAVADRDRLRGKWLGPYITFTSAVHPRYGNLLIQKHAANHATPCTADELCYLWVVYSNVKPDITREVNELIDGLKEPAPESEGRVQWDAAQSTSEGPLFYRAGKALKFE
ncbi:MAG: hypothetical protein WAZ18_04715 [Alphaproteobacteria bacterium]